MTKVSVIIPAYNCANSISETIESVLSQSYPNFEIIVVDDGSTDNTQEVLMPYIINEQITYICQMNMGPCVARNRGIKASKGEYIAFLDADDILLDESLSRRVQALEDNPDVYLIITDYNKKTEENSLLIDNVINRSCFLEEFKTIIINKYDDVYILKELFNKIILEEKSPPLISGSMMVRREVINNCGYFHEGLKYGEFTHYLMKVSYRYSIGYIDEPLWVYNNYLSHLSKVELSYREKYSIIRWESLLEELSVEGLVRKNIINRISKQCFDLGYLYYSQEDFEKAQLQFIKCVKYNPIKWKAYLYLIYLMTCNYKNRFRG